MIPIMDVEKDKQVRKYLPGVLLLAYVGIFIVVLRTFLVWQSVNLILGLFSIPFISTIDPCLKGNKRFGFAAIAIVVLSFVLPVKTMLFVSMLFAILFLIENFLGKVNMLPVLSFLLISPFFQYVVSVFSFSIRILLSTVAGKLLNLVGDNVSVSGNMIAVDGNEFAVDQACMGLNMMVTSVLLGIVLIGIFQRRFQQTVCFWQVMVLLAVISAFNILSNLLRIILLVRFSIMPEDFMHEIAGLICLLLYVCIPSVHLVKWAVNKFGKSKIIGNQMAKKHRTHVALHSVLFFSITLLSFKIDTKEVTGLSVPKALSSLPEAKIEAIADNIIKIETDDALIYIKPVTNFYNSEHNPSICWKGSGYEMKKINTESINAIEINTAELRREKSTLFTAWWFDNGEYQTVSQFEWRWRMFKGSKPFSVVNVTAATSVELKKQISFFFSKRLSRQILLSQPTAAS